MFSSKYNENLKKYWTLYYQHQKSQQLYRQQPSIQTIAKIVPTDIVESPIGIIFHHTLNRRGVSRRHKKILYPSQEEGYYIIYYIAR